jgi:hypothetical protein
MSGDSTKATILQQSLYLTPLRNASARVQDMQNIVQRAVATGYNGTSNALGLGESLWLALLGGACLPLATLVVAGSPVFGAIGIVACAFFGLGAMSNLWETIQVERDPSYYIKREFKKAARALSAAATPLPDGLLKQSVKNFADEAARDLVLGHVATLQGRIVWGGESMAERKKMFKKGMRLIEEAAQQMLWTDGGELKTAFSSGRLPEAETFGKRLCEEHGKLQGDLRRAIQRNQPKPA